MLEHRPDWQRIKSCVVTPNADARKLFYLAVSEIRQEDDDLKPIHTQEGYLQTYMNTMTYQR